MKKFILLLASFLVMVSALGQTGVAVTGMVTDVQTGIPIANYPVTIFSDSISGFFYYNTVYTDVNGNYSDSLISPVNSGLLYVRVYDCNYVLQQDTCNFYPGNTFFIKNFSICYVAPPICDADFTYNLSGFLTVNFTDQSTGTPDDWTWNFGDGGSSNLQNPSHNYASAGTYTVLLLIFNTNTLCYDSVFKSVVVSDSTGGGCQAYFQAIPDSVNPQLIRFFDSSTGNILYWSWNFGDPASGINNTSSIQNPIHEYTAPGIYNVCLTIQGADSLCYDTYCYSLLVGNNSGCQAQFTYYTDSMPGTGLGVQFVDLSYGTPTSWSWDFGDGSPIVTDQNPYHIYAAPGAYYTCLTIQCQGVTSTWCQNVTVQNGTNCVSYFTYTAAGLSVAYEGHMVSGAPATYQWNFGDGTTATGQNETHTYVTPGIYYVTLTTADTTGCTYSTGQSVMVGDSASFHQIYGQVFAGNFPSPGALVYIFSLDTNANYNPYFASSVLDSNGVYYFSMVPNGNYLVYAIPFDSAEYLPTYYGDVLNWNEATVISLGEPNNPYNIHLLTSGDLIPGIGTITGQVNTGDFAMGMVDKITMILYNELMEAISFESVDAAGAFYFPTLDYGTYYLHPELAGVTSDVVKVFISPVYPNATVNMTFTGGKILGVEDKVPSIEAGTLYPNPVTDIAYLPVTLKSATRLTVELFNLTGQRVYQNSLTAPAGITVIRIPLSGLPSGFYGLKVTGAQGETTSSKLLKSQ